MSVTVPKVHVVQEDVGQTIHRLETFVSRMERRYECNSAFAASAVARGDMRETAEVGRWLISYRMLQRLSHQAGHELAG